MDDTNLPSLQCRVYDRIAVQNENCTTDIYCLELSAGNTFDFGFCRKENVPSLIRDVMTFGNIRALTGQAKALMIPTVPSALWVKNARKFDPSKIIMWLENSIQLTEEYKDCIVRLHRMGMRFAIRVDAMGDIASNSDILKCVDYFLVDVQKSNEFYEVIENFRKTRPEIKTIGFKKNISIFSFTKEEAHNYDYVLGMVEQPLLKYETLRPKWQHEMLRTFAMLYSSIYDVKEIGVLVANYPLMSASMKGMMNSKTLAVLSVKKTAGLLTEKSGLTQTDLRNFLAISVGFNLFSLTEKQICDQMHVQFKVSDINYEPFIEALLFGKIVDLMAQTICDDVTAPQAFIAGFLRYAHAFLHDTEERTFVEFPLDAVSTCYTDGGGQLGTIIRVILLLIEHKIDEAMFEAQSAGLVIQKDQLYTFIAQAINWTDVVCRSIGIIKEPKEDKE